jgi:hypothetical protein
MPTRRKVQPRVAKSKKRNIETETDDSPTGNLTEEEDRKQRPGPGSAGQSGDTQGLSDDDEASSESVLELVEEGQAFEAGIVAGIENAPDADAGPVRTREIREDDVPPEYDEKEPGDQR